MVHSSGHFYQSRFIHCELHFFRALIMFSLLDLLSSERDILKPFTMIMIVVKISYQYSVQSYSFIEDFSTVHYSSPFS